MENWVLVYTTDKTYEAAIVKGKLEKNGIPVMLVNKQDSSYIFLGELELYVPARLRSLAADLLRNNFTN